MGRFVGMVEKSDEGVSLALSRFYLFSLGMWMTLAHAWGRRAMVGSFLGSQRASDSCSKRTWKMEVT